METSTENQYLDDISTTQVVTTMTQLISSEDHTVQVSPEVIELLLVCEKKNYSRNFI